MSSEKQATKTAQPEAIAPMVVAGGGNKNVNELPYDSNGKRDWSFGLYDCFAQSKKCCLSFWCPCLVHAQNRRRLDYLTVNGVPDPERNQVTAEGGLFYGFLEVACDLGFILQIGTRKDIRERYNIRGSGMSDCCVAFWCQPCDLVQGSRELELEENSFGLEPTSP